MDGGKSPAPPSPSSSGSSRPERRAATSPNHKASRRSHPWALAPHGAPLNSTLNADRSKGPRLATAATSAPNFSQPHPPPSPHSPALRLEEPPTSERLHEKLHRHLHSERDP